jgi:hypothetical protein
MTSSRIEGPASLPPTICAPPDRSRRTQTAVGATRRPVRDRDGLRAVLFVGNNSDAIAFDNLRG